LKLKFKKENQKKKDMKHQAELWAKTIAWFPRALDEKLLVNKKCRR